MRESLDGRDDKVSSRAMLEEVWLYSDGATRGNPGPAAAGYRILGAGEEVLAEHEETLGERTNNQAEYAGLIGGLEACRDFTTGRVRVGSDSELVVNQMKGLWRVKQPGLERLHEAARALAAGFADVQVSHYRRSHPQIARVDRALNERGTRKFRPARGLTSKCS
jgi:ribonuclease HI